MNVTTTLDGLLNRRVALEQPAVGYRVAVDTVLLAASAPALAGDRVLDMGCGVGGALLCLACRVQGVRGVGLDIQENLITLFERNIARNEFAKTLVALVGDVTALADEWSAGFDQVIMNPPYHEAAHHDVSANPIKDKANSERDGELALWLGQAMRALKPTGCLTLIHRADRVDEILQGLRKDFGEVHVLPVVTKPAAKAKRVILRARKSGAVQVQECQPLTLHQEGGGYTDKAEAVLRDAQGIVFQSP